MHQDLEIDLGRHAERLTSNDAWTRCEALYAYTDLLQRKGGHMTPKEKVDTLVPIETYVQAHVPFAALEDKELVEATRYIKFLRNNGRFVGDLEQDALDRIDHILYGMAIDETPRTTFQSYARFALDVIYFSDAMAAEQAKRGQVQKLDRAFNQTYGDLVLQITPEKSLQVLAAERSWNHYETKFAKPSVS